ncbi:PRKR-interacting protein 1 homolog [Venturia canescens]|uniref:PRKR-interacting protein 1 homolog n=1 Tax=Venturia canescens TaxID=32260 RepID=UPI001C9C6670|nr:PRKR-interacting protein 1 homolog [Venturia canescens]
MRKSEILEAKKDNTLEEEKKYEKPVVAKTAYDLQRLKLMKLMKNPEKQILLPERPKSKTSPSVPEFVRNVMGSSAGAGSGEFHVYRHLRRKEYSRQKFIQEKGRKETLDEEYHRKIMENREQAEKTTAKKRAKRLKKKQKHKETVKEVKPLQGNTEKGKIFKHDHIKNDISEEKIVAEQSSEVTNGDANVEKTTMM